MHQVLLITLLSVLQISTLTMLQMGHSLYYLTNAFFEVGHIQYILFCSDLYLVHF